MAYEKPVKKSLLITNSGINQHTGGGVVSFNILRALQQVSEVEMIHTNDNMPDNQFEGIPCLTTNPLAWGYEQSTPFFADYISQHHLPENPIDILATYGCPMNLAVEKIKRDQFCKVYCDLAPHIIELSREEHKRWNKPYNYPHLIDDNVWKMYSRHLMIADQVIVHSKQGAAYIKEKAELKTDPIIIPHGCYLPDEIPEMPESITPGYFGAISPDKGTLYLLNAWVQSEFSNKSKLIFAGWGTQGFAVGEKHRDKIQVMGPVNSKMDFYKHISFLVVPSVTEGFGISVLEAMAYGRPVICAEGAGAVDLVEDGKNGAVVPIRDIGAIHKAITYFYDNPDEIKRMGENARKTAEKYTWNKIINKYVEVFK